MKRLLATALAFCMCLRIFTVPTYAAETDEYFPYITDEEGYILEEGNVAYLNAAVLVQGGGAGVAGFIGGAASVAPGVAAVIGLIAATGAVIYSVEGIVTEATRLYNLLSPYVQQWLTDAYQSYLDGGTNAITITEQLASEFSDAFDTVFYEDDGSLAMGGVTFDASNLLQYDYDSQRVYGNDLTSTIYKYSFSTTPVAIAGTTLTVAKTNSPALASGRSETYGLTLTNTVTGVSLDWTPAGLPTIYDCSQLSISAPAVESLLEDGFFTYHVLGFWLLDECSLRAAGEACSHHTARYQSSYLRDSSIRRQPACMTFSGTDTLVDDVVIDGWYLKERTDGRYVINWIFDTMIDGASGVDRVVTPLERLLASEEYVISAAPDLTKPLLGDIVYMPTTTALANVETVTQTGAQTGVYEDVIADSTTTDTPTDQTGFWEALWGWLQKILDAILSLPQKIADAIKTMLVSIFVPAEGFFDDFFADVRESFEDRFGILTFPISLVYDLLGRFTDLEEEEPILRWPSWSYADTVVIPAGEYNLNDMLETPAFERIHDIYLLIVDAAVVFGLVALLRKKYTSIIMN